MIGLDRIVGVPLVDMARGGEQLVEHSQVGRCPVRARIGREQAVFQGADEEAASGYQIPRLRQVVARRSAAG